MTCTRAPTGHTRVLGSHTGSLISTIQLVPILEAMAAAAAAAVVPVVGIVVVVVVGGRGGVGVVIAAAAAAVAAAVVRGGLSFGEAGRS